MATGSPKATAFSEQHDPHLRRSWGSLEKIETLGSLLLAHFSTEQLPMIDIISEQSPKGETQCSRTQWTGMTKVLFDMSVSPSSFRTWSTEIIPCPDGLSAQPVHARRFRFQLKAYDSNTLQLASGSFS